METRRECSCRWVPETGEWPSNGQGSPPPLTHDSAEQHVFYGFPSWFKTHPNVDKKLFTSESVIGLKNPDKSFPINNDVGVLKWRLQTTDEALIPLTSQYNRPRLLCRVLVMGGFSCFVLAPVVTPPWLLLPPSKLLAF